MIQDFPNGTLELPSTPPPAAEAASSLWSTEPVVCALILLSAVLLVLNLRPFLTIVPSIFDLLSRWKGNVQLEHNITLAIERNRTFGILTIPLLVLAYRYPLWNPAFMGGISNNWRIVILLGALVVYKTLHFAAAGILPLGRKMSSDQVLALRSGWCNYLIVGILAMLAVHCVQLLVPGSNPASAAGILYGVLAAFRIWTYVASWRNLHSSYNAFLSFLYLCALEFLPDGILIATGVLL